MNKTYKYTLSAGEKKEVTFDVGVNKLAISNANGEDGKTYVAGNGVSIDEQTNEISIDLVAGNNVVIDGNKISALFNQSIVEKVGTDVNGFDLYRKAFSLSNVSGSNTINLNLPSTASGIYLIGGFGKDSSNNIYPLTDNERIGISFTNTSAIITIQQDLTLTLLNFVIEYYSPSAYLKKKVDTSEPVYLDSTLYNQYNITYLKDFYIVARVGASYSLAITLEPTDNVCNCPNAFSVAYYTSCNTSYTYNGHTIYYNKINTGWINRMVPKSVYEGVQSNDLANYNSDTNALNAFIDAYFG